MNDTTIGSDAAVCQFQQRPLHAAFVAMAAEVIRGGLPAATELVVCVDKDQRYVIVDEVYGGDERLWEADSPGCEMPGYGSASGEPWVACMLQVERSLRTALQGRSPETWGWARGDRAGSYRVTLPPAGSPVGKVAAALTEAPRPEIVIYCALGEQPQAALVIGGERRQAEVYIVDAGGNDSQGDWLQRAAAVVVGATPAAAQLIVDAFADAVRSQPGNSWPAACR